MAKAIRWDLVADPTRFNRGFREAERTSDRLGKTIRRTAGLIGGAFAGIQVAGFLKGAIDEAREAQKVGRQTAAVIKATGGAAKVSAKDVDRLATALSNKAGVDDEVIAAGANMLLTFKGVRNEVGKNNDVFNQASATILDMTAAMHQGEVTQQGLEKASIQVGKALNDPIKGISALSRVGVTFTQGQKDQIAALVESGRTMEAQKLILAELKSEFGGAAAAASDPWQRLGVVMGNIKEEIGLRLLPTLEKAADWLAVNLPAALDFLGAKLADARDWWDRNADAIRTLGEVLSSVFVPAADDAAVSTQDLTDSGVKLEKILSIVSLGVSYLVLAFLRAEEEVNSVMSGFASLVTFAGHAVNAIDRLSGGTGHAGDAMVAFGQDLKETARRELRELKEDARNAQAAIDKLHGKNVEITATTGLQFTKTFTKTDWSAARQAAGRMATGGQVGGSGPRGQDNQLRWLAPDEHVWTGREVAAVGGHAAMAQWRRAVLAGEVPELAGGGPVLPGGVTQTGRAHSGVNRMMGDWTGTKMLDLVRGMQQAAPAGGNWGAGSWQRAISELRGDGVPFSIMSTFRPGARTRASGSTSYHALNRAVDLAGGNLLAIFNALTDTNPTELIYSGASRYKSRRGWSPIGRLNPITLADHWDHVHAAYDQGGWLPPGLSVAYNGTGRPERVLGPGEGGGTFNINVTVGPGGHPAEVGAAVVSAIQAYEGRNGTGWRR